MRVPEWSLQPTWLHAQPLHPDLLPITSSAGSLQRQKGGASPGTQRQGTRLWASHFMPHIEPGAKVGPDPGHTGGPAASLPFPEEHRAEGPRFWLGGVLACGAAHLLVDAGSSGHRALAGPARSHAALPTPLPARAHPQQNQSSGLHTSAISQPYPPQNSLTAGSLWAEAQDKGVEASICQ